MKIKISIPMSAEDLEDLREGKSFDWCFKSETSKHDVDVHIYNEETTDAT